MSTLSDRLFVAMQYLLPARAMGAVVHRLARSRRAWLKNALIRSFTRVFAVDETEMDEARAVDYPTFNAFFTRGLKPGARPTRTRSASAARPTAAFSRTGRSRAGACCRRRA
jgi:phosphatidylserine decarboxylase